MSVFVWIVENGHGEESIQGVFLSLKEAMQHARYGYRIEEHTTGENSECVKTWPIER